MKFDKYPIANVLKENLEQLGFKKPTDIQFRAIPSILKGEDVLAIAQTGTGKTAAFAIPIIDYLLKGKSNAYAIRCLVMVPTRELAVQIGEVFEKLAENTHLKVLCIYGGTEQDSQIKALKNGVDILIATPGRMFDLRSQGYIEFRQTEILVLDEADQMLALGFIKDIRDIIRYLPRERQTLFFSATINEEIKKLAYSIVKNAIRIQISPKDPVSKNVHHQVAFIEMDDKRFFLERLIKQNEGNKFLVFVRTKIRAERVASAMERVGVKSLTMHGDKAQEDRLAVMRQFKNGETNVLIATDISARGIDIEGVGYVINYDLPDVAENYVHRVGRTGRGMQKGYAVSFCAKEELEFLEDIEEYIGKEIEKLELDKSDYNMTIALSEEENGNWKKLIADFETDQKKRKKGKK
jgi:ATP-dependent RNA helicase RhlE